jgi:hypothetical protein
MSRELVDEVAAAAHIGMSVAFLRAARCRGVLGEFVLLDIPPTLELRALEVKSLVNGGKFAKFARSAYAQQSTFRSSTTNHSAAQIFGFKPEARDTAQKLVNAFCVGVTIANPKRNV